MHEQKSQPVVEGASRYGLSGSRLEEVVDLGAEVRGLPSGYDIGSGRHGAGWGKGCDAPLWLPEYGCLSFSDVGACRRLTWSPQDGYLVLHENNGAAQGASRDAEGRIVSCEYDGKRVSRLETDGTVRIVADAYEGRPLNLPDDVVVRSDGWIYFTDRRQPRFQLNPAAAPTSGVYRVSPDLRTIERLVDDVEWPSGLAFSPDEKTLYLSDADNRRLLAYAVGADGALRGTAPRAIGFPETDDTGAPHGIAVDRAGAIYVGGPGGLWIFDPDGSAIGRISLTASRITNLAFGGEDGRRLIITTPVGVGILETRVGIAPPRANRPWTLGPAINRKGLRLDQAVERHHPDLDRLIAPGAQVQNLASGGFYDDLGGGADELYARSLEGTFWSAEEGCLHFSDIGNNRRMRWRPGVGLSLVHRPTNHTNGATLDLDGAVVQAEHKGRRISRLERDGSTTVVVDRFEGRRLNRCNDVVVRSDGAVFFTDPWWDFGAGDEPELGYPGVHQVSPDRTSITLISRRGTVPNGLAFSPDERILYVNDSQEYFIRAFDILADGSVDLGSEREVIRLSGSRPGSPDGLKVDTLGNLYCSGSGGVWVVSPEGRHLGTIRHGATQANNLAFGDADWMTLYFCSWVSLHAIRLLVPGVRMPPVRPAVLAT